MVDDEKPFPCTSPGCSMRFTNEDHLSIHKRRHMSLSIESSNGSKTSNFVADETPTPTRFIRNCEEVGLFQDLNVNPFDEQFRRAAEVTTHLSPSTLPSADDVLHTPHVFPVLPTEPEGVTQLPPPKSANVKKHYLMPSLSTSECLTLPSPTTTPVPTPLITVTPPTSERFADTREDKTLSSSSDYDKTISIPLTSCSPRKDRTKKSNIHQNNGIKTTTNPTVNIMPRPVLQSSAAASDPMTALLLRLPDGRLVQIPAIPVPTETDTSNLGVSSAASPVGVENGANKIRPMRPIMSETKLKLKQALTKTRAPIQPLNGTSTCGTSDASGTDTELLPNSDTVMNVVDSTQRKNRRRSYNSASDQDLDEEESEKRRRFLERNRAAAFRSRQKRKRWVTNLEAKTNVMNTANKLLQNEVMSLRNEVAQLKLQLLAHKDCPVTLAMCQQQHVTMNSSTDGLAPGGKSNGVTTPTSANFNSTVSNISTSRQIIILNSSNQNPTPLPILTRSKPTHPSLIMVPRVENSVAIVPHPSDSGQQTSVIMSIKDI
ncbi:cyclic AMP-dependent transcription factor ATF-7 isoform X1 [Daphnia magna]|nr:cyclic AMP-dependent transcription factor ATF-7 isoform X1 [Daphnia magna]